MLNLKNVKNKSFDQILFYLFLAAALLAVGHLYGYNLSSRWARAAALTSVTVAPNANNVDNLLGNTNATWKFTVNNTTGLEANNHAVEITFPAVTSGDWDLSAVAATSTATGGDAVEFATSSLPVNGNRVLTIMVTNNQTSASNDFTLTVSGVRNPNGEVSTLGSHNWSVRTCTLATPGNPTSPCTDLDSATTGSGTLARRGGVIADWSFTPTSYSPAVTTQFTVSFTASTTLNTGEKIHLNFPIGFNITAATTSDQTIVSGGTAQVASTTIATSTDMGLNQIILTLSAGSINPAATSTVTLTVGNIVNPAKGAYQNLKVFTTTANNGLVDGIIYGMDPVSQFSPPPVDSIQIGGDNTVSGTVKIRLTNGTLRAVTAGEAAQMKVGMGSPDLMFFAGTKVINDDGTFTYNNLLNSTYILFVMPLNNSDSSFFANYIQPAMIQVNVTGNETAAVQPIFEIPDGVLQGSISGGPASATGVFVRAYTGTMESFSPMFTSTSYVSEGLSGGGVGYFQIPIKTGATWNLSFISDTTLTQSGVEYWTPAASPVYIAAGVSTTTVAAVSFVAADKTLNVTLRKSSDNSVIDETNPPAPCLSVRRAGSEMMGPGGAGVCTTTLVNSVKVYQLKVPAGAFVIQLMMPGGFKEYPVTIASTDTTVNQTIIIQQSTNYITGSVTDPDSFPVQGASVMAQGSSGAFSQALTNSSGVYTLYVPNGVYRLEVFVPGFGPLAPVSDITISDAATTSTQNFALSAANFKKISGRVFTDVNSNSVFDTGTDTPYSDIQINAYGPSGQNSTMTRSDGSYTLRVPAGTGYTVRGWSKDLGELTPLSGVDASSDVSGQNFLMAAQGYLEITITAGNTYGLSQVFAGVFNPSTGKGNGSDTWTATSSNADLITKFSAPAGTYRVHVGSPAFGNLTDLAANINATTTTITAGNTSGLTIVLPQMATLSGTTRADATVWASRADGPGRYTTIADSSGAYSMKIPKDYTYMVGATLPGYVNTPSNLTLTANTTQDLTLAASSATISGTVYSGSTPIGSGFVWAVRAGNTGWTGTEVSPNGTYSLEVDSGSWTVYANGPCLEAGAGVSQAGSGTVNFTLNSIAGCTFAQSKPNSIVPTTGGVISQDDVSVNIPPNALGTGSTNVTVSVTKPDVLPPATLNAAPISSSTKRILATTNNSNITNLNNSIELTLNYSEADLPAGASESNLQLAYWDTTAKTWSPIAATLDTTNNKLTAKVTHLTDFAPIIPTADNAPSTPTGLTAVKYNSSQIDLSWSIVSAATNYLIYRDTSSGGSFPLLTTINSGSTLSYSNTGLSGNTAYYYKISASNSNGESAASGAASATTDPTPGGAVMLFLPGGGATPSQTTSTSSQTTATTTEKVTLPQIIEKISEEVTTITDGASMAAKEFAEKIIAIAADAAEIVKANINGLLGKLGFKRDLAKEEVSMKKYVKALIKNAADLTTDEKNALNNFITYGTPTTLGLGEGERAGVINSYKSAFGKLPHAENEWSDAIKIANGRWPSQTNKQTETNAEEAFRKIYLRAPDRTNPHDDAAVTVIAYGLRPANRNLNSEKAAIKIFKAIYGYNPVSAMAWDIVRAIAYSGATR